MLSRLIKQLAGIRQTSYPSIVLIIGQPSTTAHVLHIVPENGVVERISYMHPTATTFSHDAATERSREQLDAVLLHVGDGETPSQFLDNVSTRATQLLSKRKKFSPEEDAAHSVDQALRSAVLESLRKRAELQPSTNATQKAIFSIIRGTYFRYQRHVVWEGHHWFLWALGGSDYGADQPPKVITWPTLPELPQLTGVTIPSVGRRFFIYSPSTILKLGTEKEEAVMTLLAHHKLGTIVPRLIAVVEVAGPPVQQGLLLARQSGTPLVELWPTLSPADRTTVKTSLAELLVRMRAPSEGLDYYGRPKRRPYVTPSEFGPPDKHAFCHNRSEWNTSRVRALYSVARDIGINDDRVHELERIQHEMVAGGATLVESPVLTHGDLSDRNILIEPSTFQVTGLIDWELANVAPAYFEYAAARLCGGHDPSWRKVLLEVLREVLRIECERTLSKADSVSSSKSTVTDSEKLFKETLVAWNSLVDVERSAQGYSDDCYWTFEEAVS
ncbi:hypothetical protein B7494_g3868 [Chlorociboria aeruginascens]|nr:hypothetical protein B7494_g3868 [Chlorociboria aeruginascens]